MLYRSISAAVTSFAPEFGRVAAQLCIETDTKLKLQMLLHNWPAVIGYPNDKNKTTDLKQAVGSGNTLCNCFEYKTSQSDADSACRAANEDVAVFVYPSVPVCMTVTGFMKIQKYQSQLLRREVSP